MPGAAEGQGSGQALASWGVDALLTEKATKLHEQMMSLREGKGRDGGEAGNDEMEVSHTRERPGGTP